MSYPRYKVGQILIWKNPDGNVVRVKVMNIRGIWYDLLIVFPLYTHQSVFHRRIEDLDDFDNVSPFLEPNKIWKELNEK